MANVLLPSEIARLVLGYLKEENLVRVFDAFLNDCKHLEETRVFVKLGLSMPPTIHGKTLKQHLILSPNEPSLAAEKSEASTQTEPERAAVDATHQSMDIGDDLLRIDESSEDYESLCEVIDSDQHSPGNVADLLPTLAPDGRPLEQLESNMTAQKAPAPPSIHSGSSNEEQSQEGLRLPINFGLTKINAPQLIVVPTQFTFTSEKQKPVPIRPVQTTNPILSSMIRAHSTPVKVKIQPVKRSSATRTENSKCNRGPTIKHILERAQQGGPSFEPKKRGRKSNRHLRELQASAGTGNSTLPFPVAPTSSTTAQLKPNN